jgi:hypothetical protein
VKLIRRIALSLLGAAILLYGGDFLVANYQGNKGLGSVDVQIMWAVKLKNGRIDYELGDTETRPCVHSLFPHSGYDPCWYLTRHKTLTITVGKAGRTPTPTWESTDYDGVTRMNIISEYQQWKQQGEDLRVKARQAMESRFRELLVEAVQIAEEYRSDFGAPLKPPSGVTSFRYKASAKPKPKKTQKPSATAKSASPPPAAAKPDPKIAGLQKRLAAAQQKLEKAKAGGAPTKILEDKIYEIEDAIRLSTQA